MKELEKHVKWSEELRNFLIDSQAMELVEVIFKLGKPRL